MDPAKSERMSTIGGIATVHCTASRCRMIFDFENSRNASKDYYRKLTHAINQDGAVVEETVKNAVEKSMEIWHEIKGLTEHGESDNLR